MVDPATLALVGEPALVDTGVEAMSSNGRAGFAVSNAGVLVYSSNPELVAGGAQDRQLTWLDRAGRPVAVAGPPTSSSRVRLAPDGNRVALIELQTRSSSPLSRSLWVTDLSRGVKTPLTSATEFALSPLWPDNTRLIFGARGEQGTTRLAERPASGVTPATTMVELGDRNLLPLDASSSGDLVVFAAGRGVFASCTCGPALTGRRGPISRARWTIPRRRCPLTAAGSRMSRTNPATTS